MFKSQMVDRASSDAVLASLDYPHKQGNRAAIVRASVGFMQTQNRGYSNALWASPAVNKSANSHADLASKVLF